MSNFVMPLLVAVLSLNAVDAHAGFFDWCTRLLAPQMQKPNSENASKAVGYLPDPGTEQGIFEAEGIPKGVVTAKDETLSGRSVWITAVDRSYQCRISYSVYSGDRKLRDENFAVPTLISEGIGIEGVERNRGLEAAVLGKTVRSDPSIQEVRIKLRDPKANPNALFDWQSQEAHQFAVNLATRADRLEVIQNTPEYKTLSHLGFTLDAARTGLWRYSSGDVDHFYLVMVRH